MVFSQWRQEDAILTKLRQLSSGKLQQLEDYLDALLPTEQENQHKQNA
jgi:hypothetical protein